MSQAAASGVRGVVREFFLLERAERRSAELTTPQRDAVRAYHAAARRRLAAAGTLRGPNQTPVALSLYREAWSLLTCAMLVSRDAATDVAALSPGVSMDALDRVLASEGIDVPPELAAARPLLVPPDPLVADRLDPEEASHAADEIDKCLQWLSHQVDPRSPRALQVTRAVRIGGAIASALLLGACATMWLRAPSNVALHKPTTSSPPAYGTTSDGAVDGLKNGRFGFHTVETDDPWLIIDLLRPHSLSRFTIMGRGDCCTDQSLPLALEVSDDGVTFQKVAERTEWFSENEPWEVDAHAVARYVRLRTQRRAVLVLSEVEVYGRPKR